MLYAGTGTTLGETLGWGVLKAGVYEEGVVFAGEVYVFGEVGVVQADGCVGFHF